MDTVTAPVTKKRHLNWYGQPLEEYQKPSCIYCLADVAHRGHVTELELAQLGIPGPERPAALHLREVLDAGGFAAFDAIRAHERADADAAA